MCFPLHQTHKQNSLYIWITWVFSAHTDRLHKHWMSRQATGGNGSAICMYFCLISLTQRAFISRQNVFLKYWRNYGILQTGSHLNALMHVMSYSNSCCYCFFQAQYFTFHIFSPSYLIFSLKCLSIWHCALFILPPLIWFVFCYHCVSFDLKILNIIHPTNLYTASLHNLNSLYLRFQYYLWYFPSHSVFQLSSKVLQISKPVWRFWPDIVVSTSALFSYLRAALPISNFLHCLFIYWLCPPEDMIPLHMKKPVSHRFCLFPFPFKINGHSDSLFSCLILVLPQNLLCFANSFVALLYGCDLLETCHYRFQI